jgi:hypothetical protein
VKIQHVLEDKTLLVNVQKDQWTNWTEVSLLLIKKVSVIFLIKDIKRSYNTFRATRVLWLPGLEEKCIYSVLPFAQ